MKTMLPYGNVRAQGLANLTLSPAAVAAATTAEQLFPLPGVLPGDFIEVNKPTNQAGLGIANARVSAKDQIAISFFNTTAGSITPTAAQVYQVMIFRPDGVPTGYF